MRRHAVWVALLNGSTVNRADGDRVELAAIDRYRRRRDVASTVRRAVRDAMRAAEARARLDATLLLLRFQG